MESSISIDICVLKSCLKISNIMPKEAREANIVGMVIYFIYSINPIWNEVAKYMLVGLPIINNIDHVFAPTNSPIKYGRGLILAFLQKKTIKGVKVMIIISLEVNIVKSDTVIYKNKKRINWEFFDFFTAIVARYLKNPTSSKTMLTNTIDMNNIRICIGLILENEVRLSIIVPISIYDIKTSSIEPSSGAIQKVWKLTFLILMTG